MQKTNSDDLKEYVFYLEYDMDKFRNGRTQTIWAKDPKDAEEKLQSWKHFGYTPKFLHSMDDFRAKREKEAAFEARLEEARREHEKHAAKGIETENV